MHCFQDTARGANEADFGPQNVSGLFDGGLRMLLFRDAAPAFR